MESCTVSGVVVEGLDHVPSTLTCLVPSIRLVCAPILTHIDIRHIKFLLNVVNFIADLNHDQVASGIPVQCLHMGRRPPKQ